MLRSPEHRAASGWRIERHTGSGKSESVRHAANATLVGGVETGPTEEQSGGELPGGAPPPNDAASPAVGVVPHG
jgi:hypothetical protein